MNVIPPNPNAVIVDSDGLMVQRFRTWANAITRGAMLDGVGSPEGVVESLPTSVYMDTTGVSGAILYIKRDADIAGDKSMGWVLV